MRYTFLDIYFYCLLAVFGASIGSFLNVVIYRIPNGNFFSNARSCCCACNKQLKARDIIPVISYILLKGRCRYCGVHISLRYPLVELLGTLLIFICFIRFGLSFRFLISFCALTILLAVSIIDLEIMEIPDSLLLALVPLAACAVFAWKDILFSERIIGFFAISLPMLILTIVINEAFGGGDIKLMAVCGFLLGWKNIILAFFLALLIGGSYAIYLLASKNVKPGVHIAFGPYLCFGIAAALLWGTEIIGLYLKLFFV